MAINATSSMVSLPAEMAASASRKANNHATIG
jgi:hypothetical protein